MLCKARRTGKKFAMKIVNRDSLSEYLDEALGLEVSILNELDHPNIMRLESAFTTTKSYYLVTELLEGGELFDRIIEKSSYSENEARELISIVFKAIQYCHEKHVCHRDLKVNILCVSMLHLNVGQYKRFSPLCCFQSPRTYCSPQEMMIVRLKLLILGAPVRQSEKTHWKHALDHLTTLVFSMCQGATFYCCCTHLTNYSSNRSPPKY